MRFPSIGMSCVTIHAAVLGASRFNLRETILSWIKSIEEAKTAEAVLTDPLVGRGVVDIDEHVLLRMPGEEPGEDFDKFFLRRSVSLHKRLTDVETMGPFAAVKSQPETRTVRSR